MRYRMSDSAPLYGLIIITMAIVGVVAVITIIYGMLHGVSPL